MVWVTNWFNIRKHSLGNCVLHSFWFFGFFCWMLVALINQPADGLEKWYISKYISICFSHHILKLQILLNCNPVSCGSWFYISLQILCLQWCQSCRMWLLIKGIKLQQSPDIPMMLRVWFKTTRTEKWGGRTGQGLCHWAGLVCSSGILRWTRGMT